MKKLLFTLLPLFILSASCKKDEESQAEKDQKAIQDYISHNNLTAKSTSSGLYYVMETEGTGKRPKSNSDVQVIYKGYLTSGTVFDQSPTPPGYFNLGQVIEGWREGIPLFKEGGKGILLIPSALGYGPQGNGKIPPNSVLIFDITLKDVL